ncbi:hypothetical protein ABS764_09615 [Flavobacterium sp. ST-87]|uniref:Uncharacterized protein n=1 Tax=Flavobacterium plantiphilum TaxID=3163297 RepID=A0ABW8XT96_9FLAO
MSKNIDAILKNQQVFILENDQYIPIEKNNYDSILKTKENTKFYYWSEI